ncbi:MAG: GNAT family N-acetyltransferase [candidate division WOR-3 bacterium]
MLPGCRRRNNIIHTARLTLRPLAEEDLDFLLSLWNDPEIMRYAGGILNWSRPHIIDWFGKQPRLHPSFPDDLFPEETHLIICLRDGRRIGESGIGKLPLGWACEGFRVPFGKNAGICDVKLARDFWGAGYGTEAMVAVVDYFRHGTSLDVLVVPPHRDNHAAIRVYEKAGFRMTKGIAWEVHLIMVMEKR